MRKHYSGFTLFKLIGASLILLAHYSKTGSLHFLDTYVPGISIQFAIIVPCFYMLSGFLVHKGWSTKETPVNYVRKYAFRLLAVYGLFCIFYLLEDTLPKLLTGRFNIHTLNALLGSLFFLGPYGPLWFIPPLAIGIYLCFRFERAGRLRFFAGILIAGFLVANLLLGTLSPFLKWSLGIVATPENKKPYFFQLAIVRYFGLSLPYILAGVLISKYEVCFLKLKNLGLYALLAVAIETFLMQSFQYENLRLAVSNLISTLWLFQVLIRAELSFIKPYHLLIQRFTLLMFLLHIPLLKFFVWWFGTDQNNFTFPRFLFCFIAINLLVALLSIGWGTLERRAASRTKTRSVS